MKGPPFLSVIIATHNRAAMLEETLTGFLSVRLPVRWELIVADNGSTDATPDVLARMAAAKLPLEVITLPRPGKSCALNLALTRAAGALVAMTDDDMSGVATWLLELLRAWRLHSGATVFCGPIVPRFPADTPEWLREHPFAAPLFGRFMPSLPEGPLPAPLLPFGGNITVRASALRDLRLNEALGPAEENLMREDTDFARRLRAQGESIVFVSRASLVHRLRAEQVTDPWLFERAFALGRSVIADTGEAVTEDLAPGAVLGAASRSADRVRFELGTQLNFHLGQWYQLARSGQAARHQAPRVRECLARLGWDGEPGLIAPSAIAWARQVIAKE